jgi:hypothetical protein
MFWPSVLDGEGTRSGLDWNSGLYVRSVNPVEERGQAVHVAMEIRVRPDRLSIPRCQILQGWRNFSGVGRGGTGHNHRDGRNAELQPAVRPLRVQLDDDVPRRLAESRQTRLVAMARASQA